MGVRLPQYGAAWDDIAAFAARAERHGFASLWVNDHLHSPGRTAAEPAFDAFTTLAALAPMVRGPRLGVAVLSASYRPAAVAAKAATLIDVITAGRMVVGLGAGSHRAEHAAYGIPFADRAGRTDHAVRTLEAMRAMFTRPEGATVPGLLDDAPNLPPPATAAGPPIWLAAHRPRMLRAAGELADGLVAAFVGPREVGRRLAVAQQARPAGLPPLACALYTYALPLESEAEVARWLEPEARELDTTPRALVRWLRTTGIVGPPDDLRQMLGEHAAAGVTEAILVLPSRVPPDALDALAEATLARAAPAVDPAPVVVDADAPRADANLVHLLVERHVAAGSGGRLAAVDDTGSWTYAELSAASARAAGALVRAGVRRGERVVVALRDGRPWLAAFLGAARMGAVPVPLDPDGGPERIADVVADCEPTAVVAEPGVSPPGVQELAPEALDAGTPAPVCPVHPADLAYLIYSSGSTGRPKGAMHGHGDMRVSVETYSAEVLALGPGDRCHSVARLYTSLGFGNGFFRPLGRGATAVLTRVAPTPRSVLALAEREGVTVLTGVPTFWSQLARFIERHPAGGALGSVRLAVSSGDRLPAQVGRRLRHDAGLELVEGLGCSECSNVVISTRPGHPLPGAIGRVVDGVEIRLADDEGHPVPSGRPGRLWIRSASNTSGYWRRPELTRDLVFGPWLRMGDVLVEQDGVYRHMGRADDLFKVDARWVSPTAVEEVLLDHPAVREAAVVGLPDADGLLRAAAFVVLEPGAGAPERELRRAVAHALGRHAAPQAVTALDRLPRLPSGKLDRRGLRGGGPTAPGGTAGSGGSPPAGG